MNEKLNKLLANLVVEYHKLQNYHWYVKGKDFFQAHTKLEELYGYINEAVDEVAENILMLEGKPLASLKDFLENAQIEEANMESIKSKYIYREVLKDFSYLLELVLDVKKDADVNEVYVVSALMDDYIKEFKKSIWMISQVVND